MNLLTAFFPKVMAHVSTIYNKDIIVKQTGSSYKLLVEGVEQTGSYEKQLFSAAFNYFLHTNRQYQHVLLFGLGGGNIAQKISYMFPGAVITAVEIDPEIIKFAYKYFVIKEIPRLEIVNADAQKYIQILIKEKKMYDLIIVDLYSGDRIPFFVESEAFIHKLSKITEEKGGVLINFQAYASYQIRRNELFQRLSHYFSVVQSSRILRNQFYWAERG